jgi:hypothetical protein
LYGPETSPFDEIEGRRKECLLEEKKHVDNQTKTLYAVFFQRISYLLINELF